MIKGGDLFGDGVNIAARLQALARAGGVCLSRGTSIETEGSELELEVVKVLQGYAIEAVKIRCRDRWQALPRHRRGADKAGYFD
jgi:hypothetical protein